MRSVRTFRVLAAGALLAGAVVTGASMTMVSAGAASSPKLVVTPSIGLKNGQTITVKGSGFKPKDSVYITECLFTTKDSTGCNIAGTVPATISAKGVLAPTKIKVVIGTIGNGTCGTKASNLRLCAVTVGNISGKDTAVTRIIFTMPKK